MNDKNTDQDGMQKDGMQKGAQQGGQKGQQDGDMQQTKQGRRQDGADMNEDDMEGAGRMGQGGKDSKGGQRPEQSGQ
ncbi:MAG: hypothetical protein WAU68_15015 [Vitreimonas sp.]